MKARFIFSLCAAGLFCLPLLSCSLFQSRSTFTGEEAAEMTAAYLTAASGGTTSSLDDSVDPLSPGPPPTGALESEFARYRDSLQHYTQSSRMYALTISSPAADSYQFRGTAIGAAERPRIDSHYTSDIDLTVTAWDGAGSSTANGTTVISVLLDYAAPGRSDTRDVEAELSCTWQNVTFSEADLDGDTATDAHPTGGVISVEAEFEEQIPEGLLNTTIIEWDGTLTFDFSLNQVTVQGTTFTFDMSAVSDDDLIQ